MGKLLHIEWYKLVRDKIYWILLAVIVLVNLIILSGGQQFSLSGYSFLKNIMQKEIITIMMASIYGGLFVGRDFEDCTLYHEITAGKSRIQVLSAKITVFLLALNGLILIFPMLAIIYCTLKNGWGIPFTAGMEFYLLFVFIALLLLNCAIGMISMLAAVCFRDVGRTIGIPIILFFIMIILLNGKYAIQFAHFLPLGMMALVTNGTVAPVYGMLLGSVWSAVLFMISALVFRRAELR